MGGKRKQWRVKKASQGKWEREPLIFYSLSVQPHQLRAWDRLHEHFPAVWPLTLMFAYNHITWAVVTKASCFSLVRPHQHGITSRVSKQPERHIQRPFNAKVGASTPFSGRFTETTQALNGIIFGLGAAFISLSLSCFVLPRLGHGTGLTASGLPVAMSKAQGW